MSKRILLTGASGLFGANAILTGQFRYEIFGMHHKTPPQSVNFSRCKWIQQDLTYELETRRLVKQIKPDFIIHAAATANIDDCETHREEAYRQNVLVSKTLAQCATENQAFLVHFSTDAFFEGKDRLFTEDDEPNPVNYYGETKLLAEKAVRENCPESLIARVNFFGWSPHNRPNLGEWIVQSLMRKISVPLFSDVIFTSLFVNKLAEIIFDIMEMKHKGILNISGDEPVSKLEFGKRICKIFGLDDQLIKPSQLSDGQYRAPPWRDHRRKTPRKAGDRKIVCRHAFMSYQ